MATTERNVSNADFENANAQMVALRASGYATAARYDVRHRRITVDLSTGVHVSFPVALSADLSEADDKALRDIEISPSGLGLFWPEIDADLYVPATRNG